jgi:hypothetical protein
VSFRFTSMYAEQIMSPDDDQTNEDRSEHTQVEPTKKRLSLHSVQVVLAPEQDLQLESHSLQDVVPVGTYLWSPQAKHVLSIYSRYPFRQRHSGGLSRPSEQVKQFLDENLQVSHW